MEGITHTQAALETARAAASQDSIILRDAGDAVSRTLYGADTSMPFYSDGNGTIEEFMGAAWRYAYLRWPEHFEGRSL